jgi:CBS domain containing-hemolysin-like protein
MRVQFQVAALRRTKWSEYVLRFVVGGCVTAVTGLIARKWGPVVGGLFLAFPAIFPASATLVEKHAEQDNDYQKTTGAHGRRAAGLDAVGSAIGSIGLVAFALVVWRLLPALSAALVLFISMLAWLIVAVLLWTACRSIPRKIAFRGSHRKTPRREYTRLPR